jgi:hypothetical protein
MALTTMLAKKSDSAPIILDDIDVLAELRRMSVLRSSVAMIMFSYDDG